MEKQKQEEQKSEESFLWLFLLLVAGCVIIGLIVYVTDAPPVYYRMFDNAHYPEHKYGESPYYLATHNLDYWRICGRDFECYNQLNSMEGGNFSQP